MPALRILHTNDFHGKLNERRFGLLKPLREEADLYFDCGDAIKCGNLAIPVSPDPAWAHLQALDCTASVPGNRESHPLAMGMRAKFAGVSHPILCANWFDKSGVSVFARSQCFEVRGVRVGVFGVMVPIATRRMTLYPASQYEWTQPIEAAREVAAALRPECDLLIALTHIGLPQDRRLAEACPELDLILGGHSHDVLESPEVIGRVSICQTGSHGRFVGKIKAVRSSSGWSVQNRLLPL